MSLDFGPPRPPEPPMTEEEWLAGADESRMKSFALWRSQRKLTLARMSQLRLVWHELTDRSRFAVEIQEDIADGSKDADALNQYRVALIDAFGIMAREGDVSLTAHLHEIFGNPFRQVDFNSAWRTSDVLLLARGIYKERAFDRMPILADAIQDAG